MSDKLILRILQILALAIVVYWLIGCKTKKVSCDAYSQEEINKMWYYNRTK